MKLLAHRYRRTTLVAVFCAALVSGIGLAWWYDFAGWWSLACLLLLGMTFRRQNLATLIFIILLGISLGGLRGTAMTDSLAAYDDLYDRQVTLTGTARGDGTYNKYKALSFDVGSLRLADDPSIKLPGVIGVSGFGENMVFRGDRLEITGKIRPSQGGHQGWMSFASFTAIERDTSMIEKVRHQFGAGMLSALPEPMASFGMGILIGQRSGLPESTNQDLLMVGLVHIVAVSGYNLTIILRAGMRLFGDRSKYQTVLFSVTLILLFLMMTGSSASVVRAAIVSALSLAAWYYGRAWKPVTLILFAAALTAVANPLYVWGDMGWYLSFLAFYGVMILGPQLGQRVLSPKLHQSAIIAVAFESFCAELMTLPIILYTFGQMSLVNIIANVAICVFMPLAMLLTFVAGLAGTFLWPVAGWFSWPAVIVLTYILDTAHVLASIPNIFIENITFTLPMMVGMYAVVLGFNLLAYSRSKHNPAIISTANDDNPLLVAPHRTYQKAAALSRQS